MTLAKATQHAQTHDDSDGDVLVKYPFPLELHESLRHNRLPSTKEIAETLAHIRDEMALSRDLNTNEVSESLDQDRRALEQRICARQSWLAPIRKLPRELLHEIFQDVCCNGFWMERDEGCVVIHCLTLKLGWVCHYWRSFVHSSPRLWASLSPDISAITSNVRRIVELYVTKSKGVPLREVSLVDLRGDLPDESTAEEIAKYLGHDGYEVLKVILGEIGRSCTLAFEINPTILGGVSPPPDLSFPHLILFSESTRGYPLTKSSAWLWECIREAPRLTALHVETLTCTHIELGLLPLRTVTCLSLLQVPGEMLLEVLPAFKLLRKLVLGGIDTPVVPLRCPVILPSLCFLIIATHLPLEVIGPFFRSITMPSLAFLDLSSGYKLPVRANRQDGGEPAYSHAWVPWFAAMLERSGQNLRYFGLSVYHSHSICTTSLPDILSQCPKLQGLDLKIRGRKIYNQESPRFTIELFNRLVVPVATDNTNLPLVPHLQIVSVQEPLCCLRRRECDGVKAIRDMAKSRAQGTLTERGLDGSVRPLTHLKVDFLDPFTYLTEERWIGLEELKEAVRPMVDGGMKCIIQRLYDEAGRANAFSR